MAKRRRRAKKSASKACMVGKRLKKGWRFGKGGRCIKAKK